MSQSRDRRKAGDADERGLLLRCILLIFGVLFFSFLAAARARSGEYARDNTWRYYEEEDWDTMSDDDHAMAARLQRRVAGDRPVYFRRKASRMHDSITIIVNERTSSELNSSNDLQRDTSNNLTLTNWLTPRVSGGLGTTQRGQLAGGSTPTISWSGARRHKSDSTIDRSQYFTTTLTGQVLDVQPNGYLVVQARKSVNVNGEVQTVAVTGIVNPAHMNSNSEVPAEYLIDMQVSYTGKGPMTRMDKRGWGAKIIDFLSPF